MEPTTPTEPRAKGNWWTRNWKWFVPTGCLAIVVLFVAFVGSIVVIVFSAIKSTDPYKDAFAKAKMHPAVIEALGSPNQRGIFCFGKYEREWRIRRSKPVHSHFGSQGKRHDLRKGGEVARALELFGSGCGNPGDGA